MPDRRPNLVFVLTDDHAAHAISAYGSVVNATPRIDEIGELGVRLDNCFVTNSLCTPSRAAILTGTYSHVNGVYSLFTPFEASQPTFISLLRDAGYRTAMFGKWHMGHGAGHDPQGFDQWDVLPGQGDYWNPLFINADGRRRIEGYATDIITDLAIDWADGLRAEEPDDDRPWAMLVWHKAPHRSWEPKPEHQALYDEPIPVPSTFWDDYSTRTASIRRVAMRVADDLNTDDLKETPPADLSYEQQALWKYQRYLRDYLACVHSVDENVGRLIDWLRKRGDFDDTMLIYSSDQGFFLGDHGWFDKRLMFEESLRMPLLVSYPAAIEAGQVFDGIVSNVDMAQTILDAARVEPDDRMQGRSFFPELTGGSHESTVEGVYYRYWENDDLIHKAPAHYGYRTERYKLIYYYNDGFGLPFTGPFTFPPEWELYDLHADPNELRNVADDPEYTAVRAALTASMWREQARLGDAPHPSQPVPEGCASVTVAAPSNPPTYAWLDPGGMNG
ncbi:MAG: sulfatase [Actinomycetota bacterium]